MSNIIPPLVSSSPPPMVAGGPDDLEDDEFGDFTAAADLSYEGYSLPSSPNHVPYSNDKFSTYLSPEDYETSKPNVNIEISPNQCAKETNLTKSSEIIEENKCDINVLIGVENHVNTDINVSKDTLFKTQEEIASSDLCESVPNLNPVVNCISNHKQEESVVELSETNEHCQKDDDDEEFDDFQSNVTVSDDFGEFSTHQQFCEKPPLTEDKNTIVIERINTENLSKNLDSFNSLQVNVTSDEKLKLHVEPFETNFHSNDSDDFDDFQSSTQLETTESCETCCVQNGLSDDINISKEINSVNVALGKSNLNSLETDESLQFKDTEDIDKKTLNYNDKEREETFDTSIITNNNKLEKDPSSKTVDLLPKNEIIEDYTIEDDDKFAEFQETQVTEDVENQELDDFDNFQGFESSEINYFSESNVTNTDHSTKPNDNHDFGDFESNFQCCEQDVKDQCAVENVAKQLETSVDDDFGDEFGDFSDYSTQAESIHQPNVDVTVAKCDVVNNAELILAKMFPPVNVESADCCVVNFMENSVFKNVESVEDTIALSYQWSNSKSQQMMLKALNIDTRNILYGPRWNASMPRFAANLGFTPLEPMKSDFQVTPMQPTPSTSQQEHTQAEVPAAKFDWTSSGLVNPLDCQPNDTSQKEQKPSSTESSAKSTHEISTLQTDATPQHNLSITQSDNESVKSLKFLETAENDSEVKCEEDSQSLDKEPAEIYHNPLEDEFTDFHSSKPENKSWPTNVEPIKVHLRETYITSNESQNITNTPEKKLEQFDDHWFSDKNVEPNSVENVPSLVPKPETISEVEPISQLQDDDDFTDFQMSLPQPNPTTTADKPQVKQLEPLQPAPLELLKPIVLESTVSNNVPLKINWPEPGIVNDDMESLSNLNYIQNSNTPERKAPELPKAELPKLVPQELSKSVPPEIPKPVTVKEEDDWSDFVSASDVDAKNSKIPPIAPSSSFPKFKMCNNAHSPKHTNLNGFNQKFSNQKPQLQLSISDLQSTQLKHKALPSMTSPNISLTKPNLNSPPSTQQIAAQQVTQGYQPPYQIQVPTNAQFTLTQTSLQQTELGSHIPVQETKKSNDFLPFYTLTCNFSQNNVPQSQNTTVESHIPNVGLYSQMKPNINTISQSPSHVTKIPSQVEDDDDWTDFVSSPAQMNVTCTNSSPQRQDPSKNASNWNKPNLSNWFGDLQPNIITNPVHFDSFQSYQAGPSQDPRNSVRKTGNTQYKAKNNIPSASTMPELDFIAPKNKFFSKK